MSKPVCCGRCHGSGWTTLDRAAINEQCPDCAGEGWVRIYPGSQEMVPRADLDAMRHQRDALEVRVSALEPALAFIWAAITPEDREAVYTACPPVGFTAKSLAALAAAAEEAP